VLQRCGRWQDNNFVVVKCGIQLLLLHDGLQVDLDRLCQAMVTEVRDEGRLEKRMKTKKSQEELLDDAKLVQKQKRRQRPDASSKIDVFAVENRVLHSDQARTLAKWLGAQDSSDLEGCHCTLAGLYLVNTMLRDEGCLILAACLPKNNHLTHINFAHNNIGDLGCTALFTANIGRDLAVLKLGSNALGDPGCKAISKLLASTPLVELHLQNNVIGDNGLLSIAQGMALSQKLQVLNLNGNRIRDKGVATLSAVLLQVAGAAKNAAGANILLNKHLGSASEVLASSVPFHTNTSLNSLHLASNWLRDATAVEISQIFQANFSLTNVELASNRIGDVGAKALAESLKLSYHDKQGHRVGRNLVLNCNNIGSPGMLELMRAMKSSNHLHTLSVEGMRVPFARRAGIHQDSAAPAHVDLTAGCKLPRLRLEAIHHVREELDIEAKVNAEFKPNVRTSKPTNFLKDSFFPIDRFMDDHEKKNQNQSSWGLDLVAPPQFGWGATTSRASTSTARLPTARSSVSPKGSSTARLPTAMSHQSNMSYTQHLMNDTRTEGFLTIDNDPGFQALCNRLNVPVQDMARNRLRALNDKQREQRARIYDKFLDIQTKFHRPVLTSATQMQSLYRMKRSSALAKDMRRQNQEEAESMFAEIKFDLAPDRNDGVQDILGFLAAPGLRTHFSQWKQHHVESVTLREDVPAIFGLYCTRMGVLACGTNLLKKFVNSPYGDALRLKGLGLMPSAARALSFLFMGVENCHFCRGTGVMNGVDFRGCVCVCVSCAYTLSPLLSLFLYLSLAHTHTHTDTHTPHTHTNMHTVYRQTLQLLLCLRITDRTATHCNTLQHHTVCRRTLQLLLCQRMRHSRPLILMPLVTWMLQSLSSHSNT